MATPAKVNFQIDGWLRDRDFDVIFIVGVAMLALIVGATLVQIPSAVTTVLFIDTWLLGYQHVVATYSRVCFNSRSLRDHRFLMMGVPIVLLAFSFALAFGLGLWALMTIYFYWQWFHYTRQSWGISRAYQRKTAEISAAETYVGNVALYLVPLWGILNRTVDHPARFFGQELLVPPLPSFVVDLAGAAAVATVAIWIVLRVKASLRGRSAIAHTLYMISHFIVFYVGYVLIADLTIGWLTVNIWHNGQYLMFVWLHNNRQFGTGARPSAKLMSYICRKRNAWLYVLLCLAISTALYRVQMWVLAMPMLLIVGMTINYHHYIVDTVIWRRPRHSQATAAELSMTSAI